MKNKIYLSAAALSLFLTTAAAAFSGSFFPTGEGVNLQWTPKTGTVHYTMVDEAICNGSSDYVYTSVVGKKDSYVVGLSSIPDGAVITKIDIVPCASRNSTGSGSSNLGTFYRFNSADSPYIVQALSGTTPVNLPTTSFSGLSLIKGPSSTLEIGGIYYSGTKGARLSKLSAVLIYDTAPAAPSNLVVTTTMVSSSQAIRLNWADNSSNETGFKVQKSLDGVVYSDLTLVGANTTIAYDYSPSFGTTNYYRIMAYNQVGFTYSNIFAVYIAPILTPPTAPTSLFAYGYNISSTRFAFLSWIDNSDNETRFYIERSANGYSYTNITSTSANISNYNDYAVGTSTYLFYRVRAYNAAGYSDYSNITTTTIP